MSRELNVLIRKSSIIEPDRITEENVSESSLISLLPGDVQSPTTRQQCPRQWSMVSNQSCVDKDSKPLLLTTSSHLGNRKPSAALGDFLVDLIAQNPSKSVAEAVSAVRPGD